MTENHMNGKLLVSQVLVDFSNQLQHRQAQDS